MPALDTITIKGFRSIASIENLKLEAINVLIGPTGSGKSNFIEALSLLGHIFEGTFDSYVNRSGYVENILHHGIKVATAIELELYFSRDCSSIHVLIKPEDTGRLAYEVDTDPRSMLHLQMCQYINSVRTYHFNDMMELLQRATSICDNYCLLRDASNLAAFLYYLRARHQTSYSLIRRAVQLVAPFFDDFLLEPQKLNPNKIRLEWKHKGSDAYFDTSSLSDGTLRFMALATLFLQPNEYRPSVILVDELELGLHPYAITILASLIKSSLARTQVIVATQSPLLLDSFKPEDVLVADRVDGGTQLTRLQSEKLNVWLENYSLGQLWEKNELGGRPGAEKTHG